MGQKENADAIVHKMSELKKEFEAMRVQHEKTKEELNRVVFDLQDQIEKEWENDPVKNKRIGTSAQDHELNKRVLASADWKRASVTSNDLATKSAQLKVDIETQKELLENARKFQG